MANQISPGVQVNEIDLTNVIPSVATSIGAFVGNYVWGPVEDIVTVGSEKDMVDQFGKPHPLAAVDFTTASMYLKYGSALRVVRAVTSSARNATSDDVATAVLIKNATHYDALSPSLSSIQVITPRVTAISYAGESQVTVDDASELTLGDVITGPNIADGTTITAITGNVVSLSQPLLGTIPISSQVNDLVQINSNHTVLEQFAKGSYQITTALVPTNGYQSTAKVKHASLLAGTRVLAWDSVTGTVTLSNKLNANIPNTDTVLIEQTASVSRVLVTAASTVAQNTIIPGTFDITVVDASLYTVGDVIYETTPGTTYAKGTTVVAIDTTTNTITLSDALLMPLSLGAAVDISVASPIDTLVTATSIGATVLAVTNASLFTVGDIMFGSQYAPGTTVTAIDTTLNLITLSDALVGNMAIGASVDVAAPAAASTVVTTIATAGDTQITVVDASQFLIGDMVYEATATNFAANTYITGIDVINNIITINQALPVSLVSGTSVDVQRLQSVQIGATIIPVVDSSFIEIGDEITCLGVPKGAKVVGVDRVLHTITIDLAVTDYIAADVVLTNTRTANLGSTIGTGYMSPVMVQIAAPSAIGVNTIQVSDTTQFRIGDVVTSAALPAGTTVTAVDETSKIITLSAGLLASVAALDLVTIEHSYAIEGEGAVFFVLDTVEGIAFGDNITATSSIPAGTKVTYIDSLNKVIGINNFLGADEPMLDVLDVYSRALIAQDQFTQQVTLTLDTVASIKIGDSISDIDPTGLMIQKGITFGSKVVSVDYVNRVVTLDTPLTGSIPAALSVNDILSVDVYRGLAYAKYPGALGNSLRVSICGTEGFATWQYRKLFDYEPNYIPAGETKGGSDYVLARGGSNDELHIVVIDEDGKFTGTPGQVLEKFAYVSQARDAKLADGTANYYVRVLNETSKYIWWGAHPVDLVNAGSFAENVDFAGLSAPLSYSLSGGSDSDALGDAEYSLGYELFRDAETVFVDFLIQPSITSYVIPLLLIDIAEFRRDCIAFISPPTSLTVSSLTPVESVVNWFYQLPSTSYAVFDNTAIKVYDKYNDQYLWIPASSSVAGLCANTDNVRDPWWSPAGLNRGQLRGVVKLAHNPKQVDRDELYSNNINPIVTFAGEGTVLYGDKTGQAKPSAFDRINVRRLFITLEKSIAAAAKFMLFEFNDGFTRAQFKSMIEPFLRDVQARRGITDFYVVCDESNNTAQIIDTNQFVGDIYIKPARSINYITLNFVAVRTGVSFQEIATGEYQ